MDILKKFGNKIKEVRTERGFSQEELAFRAELHRTYVGAVERGEKNISLKNIDKIAKALKIKIKDLFE